MKMKSKTYLALLFFITVCNTGFLSCNSTTTTESETGTKDASSKQSVHSSTRPVHWSYTDHGGPAGWGELSPVYSLCGSGKSQSPIDLLPNAGKGTTDWKIDYKTTALTISHNEHVEELINNGHTIQITTQEGSRILYGKKIYHLRQFHFHTPGEHTINGKDFPMEVHLVHESDDKSLAVIGVLVQEGKYNSNFEQLIKHLPNAPGEKITKDSVNIDVAMNVPKELYAWHYVGSLTTPPCTENVQWLVLRNPISMSKEQIAAFSSRMKNNNRPTQPLNERKPFIDDIVGKNKQ